MALRFNCYWESDFGIAGDVFVSYLAIKLRGIIRGVRQVDEAVCRFTSRKARLVISGPVEHPKKLKINSTYIIISR